MQTQIFFSMILATCGLSLALSFYAFRQRKVPGVRIFSFFALAEAMLAFSEILSMVSKTIQASLFWFNFRGIFLAITPVLWLFFILKYYRNNIPLTKRFVIALCIIPLITIALPRVPAISHLWVQQNVSFFQVDSFLLADTSSRIPGVWFYVHTNYSFLMVIASMVVILIDIFKKRNIRRLLSLILITGSAAYLAAGLYPSLFPVGPSRFNPIIPGIGFGELLQVIAIFSLNFLSPSQLNSKHASEESIKMQERESQNLLVLIFVIIAASIASLGFLSFNNFQRQYRSQVEAQLTSISLLKVADIQKWRNERLDDAQAFFQNESFSLLVENHAKYPDDQENVELIKSWLRSFSAHQEYDQIFFINSNNSKIIGLDDAEIEVDHHILQEMPQIMKEGTVTFNDFHRDSDDSPVYLSLIIPIYSTSEHTPLGILVLRINPQVYLYPLILRWPVPSETAETALVRLEDDKVVYLTELRFESDAILNKYIDLNESNRPSVKAITGSIGIVEGINYRGKQVIGDVRPIPDTPWFLVSRIDLDEIEAPLLEREQLSWFLYSALIFASGVALLLIWRQQKMRSLITSNKIQTEILERDRKLKEAQELAHLGFWYWDVNTGDVEWSEEVFKIFGIDPKVFKPRIDTIMALSPWPEDQKRDQELIDRAIKTHQAGMYEQKFLRPDNSIGYYSSTFLGIFDDSDRLKAIVGSVMDITDRTNKENALKASEHRFRTLFEHAAVGVAIIDTKTGQYLDINKKYCEFLGYSKQEMLSRTFQSVTAPVFKKINIQYNRKLIEGKIKEYVLEKVYVRKDGKKVWGELNASALWKPGTIPEHYQHIAVVKDITDQKSAELALRISEKKFRETVANLDEGYYSTTLDGILLEHNQAFNRILGYPAHQDLKGLAIPDFWQDKEQFERYNSELNETGSVIGYQIDVLNKDGAKITLLLSAHIINDESNIRVRVDGVLLDITARILQEERLLTSQVELQKLLDQAELSRRALLTIIEDQKIAQEEIRLLNKTLEEKVSQRTSQLKASNEELESFAYSISHDLRAPLRAIDGYSRILEQDYAKVLDTEGIRLLNIVRNSTKNLDHLITDLLSLSRVGRSELKMEKLEMDSMVDSIYQELMPPELQEKFKFIHKDLPQGYGDPTLIRHVWMNLISNAIKYSTPKENPMIEVTGSSDGKNCTYTISDNGVGFNPDFKDKLFGLFQRLHKVSDFEGTGVGLAIVHRIIERHNGEVWGHGELDIGAEFSFALPERSASNE